MRYKKSRYGYNVPEHWIMCKNCPDMVDEDISNIYIYGYCPHCVKQIPNYIPTEQWEKWLNGKCT